MITKYSYFEAITIIITIVFIFYIITKTNDLAEMNLEESAAFFLIGHPSFCLQDPRLASGIKQKKFCSCLMPARLSWCAAQPHPVFPASGTDVVL